MCENKRQPMQQHGKKKILINYNHKHSDFFGTDAVIAHLNKMRGDSVRLIGAPPDE